MTCSLSSDTHNVKGFNISNERMALLVAEGSSSDSALNYPPAQDCVVIVVLNEAQTLEVLFGADDIVAKMKSGSVIVTYATITPEAASCNEALCAEEGLH